MQVYLDLLRKIMDKGVTVQTGATLTSEGRQPTAKRLHAAQIQFDMADGFPACTTKPLWWRAVVAELIWFLRGSGNIGYLRAQKVSSIWDAWVKKDKDGNDTGDLGRVYGIQFRRWRDIQPVAPRQYTPQPPPQPPFFALVTPTGANTAGILGKSYTANNQEYGTYRVVFEHELCDAYGHRLFDIQFDKTGYTQARVNKQSIEQGRVKDQYATTVYGTGRLGEPIDTSDGSTITSELYADLKKVWTHMLERCYNPECKEYPYYGGRGIVVDGPWHVFSRFVEDVHFLEGWELKHANPGDYQLDKDYTGGGCYAQDTCVWLHRDQQKLYRSNSRPFRATSPDGVTYTGGSAGSFARNFGLEPSKIGACIRGERPHHRGWTFKDVPQDGMIYREREIDQIANARDDIRAVIADPFNRARRRIIVTLWNPADIEAMALPPCHSFHFYDMVPPRETAHPAAVREDNTRSYLPTYPAECDAWTLNIHLCARSIDAVKGLPFNIASYALMLHVMAKITGTRPGTLTISFNDVHIYDNQFADVEEQLKREPYDPPTLAIDPVFLATCPDLSIEQAHTLDPTMFKLRNYEHHPKLKSESEVAV